jgi:ubiquitin carboxyl-terminal hydrolase 34
VDTVFFNDEAIDIDRLVLLSPKFVSAAKPLLREDKGFVAKVLPLFEVDPHELRAYAIKCFVQADGPRHLAQMIRLNLEEPYRDEAFLPKVNNCIQFADSIGAYAAFYLSGQEGLSQPLAEALATSLLDIFDAANEQLLGSLDKQQDSFTSEMRKNLLEHLASILGNLFLLTPERSHDIFSRVGGQEDLGIENYYKPVTVLIWKLKLMITYMTKARMELRLQGIDVMAKELVDYFNNYKEKTHVLRSPNPGPLLSFIAKFLLKEKITEYLFGVASHPQLIARSGNVIGFLAVTNSFSRQQAELMWRAIKDSQDPRVVAASFPVFGVLIKSLTDFEEDVMVCEIILSESLPFMSPQAADFLLDLLGRLRQFYQDYHFQYPEKTERLYHVPLELCVELIRTLSPTSPQTPQTQLVYDQACEVLAALAPLAPLDVRKALFEKCIENIRKSPEDGAAASQSIHLMLRQTPVVPKVLTQELGFVAVLMESFCSFVATKRAADTPFTMQQLNLQLWPRLNLIWYVVATDEGNIDEQLVKRFWSHLVGSDALNNTSRDVAWHRLSMITFNPGMDNSFLERHQELLSPTQIEPQFFTSGFFSFIQKLATSKMRAQVIPELNEDGTINIPGLDLIWNALLRAPEGVGEDNTIQYLIARYLDELWLHRTSKTAVEATHTALVNEGVNRMSIAHKVLRQTGADAANGIDSGTDILMPTQSREEAELIFIRTVKFLKKFLLHVRTLKEHRSKSTEIIDITEEAKPPTYCGTMISIKCEIMRQAQRAVSRVLIMGSLDTCRQLYRRICLLLGEYNVASFQLFGTGKRLYLREHPRMTLEDAGIARAPNLILREGASGEEARKNYIIPGQQWRSAFEQQLVARLEVFYGFLDGTDAASAVTFDLLKNLPRYQALKEIVSSKDAAAEDLFPMSQPFKTCYSLECLRELLEAGSADDAFIVHGARLLESLLPDDPAIAEGSTLYPELIADTVSCLYEFFIAGEGKGLDLFSDYTSVMRRVVGLCLLGISIAKAGSLAWDSYELSIDLLSSSEAAWQEFARNPQVITVHEHLLFAHPDPIVRRMASQLIRRKLEQWPARSCVSLPTFAMFLWSLVSGIIPQAVVTPQQASETFDIAILLYKSLLQLELFAEDQVKGLFNAWSPMIVSHVHHERVGQDEVDMVLHGLAALLRLTVEALPTVISSPEKIRLMGTIWWRFLFQQNPHSHEEVARLAIELPVLETETRTELVLLLDALSTDADTVNAMCNLLGDVAIQHKFIAQVDKTSLLRSPAGFVGLKNLGQTCYMNSLVTQLFMNPVFRAFILSCAPLTKSTQSPLLYETQRLFATMQNSYRGWASAESFTQKIVTLTEEIIDVREQMDVDEFMNTLFHRWEEQMPSAELKGRLRSVYTGKTVQQIKSKECEHVSEREDTCLAIS